MRAVYRARYEIPELGVLPGDLIVVRPAHPDHPLLVVRQHNRDRLPLILDHIDRLTHLPPTDASPTHEDVRRQLRSRYPRRWARSRLRVVDAE